MNDCVFCKIISREIPANIVYEDDNVISFLDLNPVQEGHLMVIPKNHTDEFQEMPDADYKHVWKIVQMMAKALKKAFTSPRVGVHVEGFGVAHAHIHVIPIYKGFEDFVPKPDSQKPSKEFLIAVSERIKAAL